MSAHRFQYKLQKIAVGSLMALLLGGLQLAPRPAEAAPSAATLKKAKRHYHVGRAAFELGRFKEALHAYERAYETAALPGLLFNIGQCYRNLGHLEKAAFSFRLYLQKLPAARNREAVLTLVRDLDRMIAAQRAQKARQQELEAKRQRDLQRRHEEEAERLRRQRDQAWGGPGAGPGQASTPIYKKWWFWTAIGVAVAGGAAGVYFGTRAGGADLPPSPFPTWELP